MLAGDLGRRTGRSESYPRSSLGVPRQVLTHGTLTLTFRGGQFFGITPLPVCTPTYYVLLLCGYMHSRSVLHYYMLV